MSLWFNDPFIKNVIPLAGSKSVRGLSATFNMPRIIMGPNSFPEGTAIAVTGMDFIKQKCPKKRAAIVTDAYSERFSGKIIRAFKTAGFTLTVWNKAQPEAPIDNVKDCANELLNFEPDLIIALGGGSAMDTAKAAWILYEKPEITDLAMVTPMALLGLRQKAIFTAIPTTSGTGSECTLTCVVYDTETKRKIPIVNGDLIPDFAVLIPEFTASMPPFLTAGTGLDALSHSMDSVCTQIASILTDAMNFEAIKLIFKYLPRAYRYGDDMEARRNMLIASTMAGIGFGNSTASLTHSFGHSLGAIFDIHHGVAVGLFIPYVLQFYQKITDNYLKICDILNISGSSSEEKFISLIKKTRDLMKEINIPLNLKELGILSEDLDKNMEMLVTYTHEDINTPLSPRPITKKECEKVFRYAYEGRDIDF